jgi:hypothetical protein
MPVEITPEPDEAERKAILEALAAEEAERSGASAWAAALLPARDAVAEAVTAPTREPFPSHVGGVHPL